MVGQTKDEGAAFYRLTINAFNNGRVKYYFKKYYFDFLKIFLFLF